MSSPRPASVPVVIVGAGPTGVTAATLLAQYGIQCLVLERYEDVYPQPRAVHADDEVRRILARVGIDDEFAAISRPALGLRLLDPKMRVLAEFRRDPTNSVHGYPQANMFDQPELEGLLRASLKAQPHAMLRGNAEVTDIARTDSGRVRVSFTDRVSSNEHVVEADYVLGCDGANSVVRSAIGAAMNDLRFEQRWLVIDVDTAAQLDQWEGVHQVCNPDRAATYMRVGDRRYRWEFQLTSGETADDYQTIPDVLPLISPWLAGTPAEDLTLVRVADYTFRAQVANRWRDRNVFILGDAAHLTPPFIGQGMAAGLRDAMNLSWKLAGVLSGDLPERVLDTYQQERKPHVRAMILVAISMGWAMTAGGDLGNFARRVIVPRLHHLPGFRARAAGRGTPPLRKSGLVIKTGHRRGLPGTLCPNPVVDNGIRLDDLVGNRFALVTSAALTDGQTSELRSRAAAVVSTDPESELGRWLRQGCAIAAIVRPDRTVMRAGRDVAALCDAVPSFCRGDRTGAQSTISQEEGHR
ncbi:bifunctional 3-(3-hydroxy-phenyl)propionate/3-hydroxycinnamic acid hydroxylase [Mycobacterium fragae]|uniref:3-(3-hydroxyphenyl)propionate hydroxylase n=1 Tax=Mycobacterium fragae TaxID=1260918 RepID=A0A1X1UYL4_9MYCO|nr:bifunctional 3-(3-hydroxy-phenyl)propionate/3-hydroxycinnamic acid hydroxylase [Mycobacterium fragae]MCV7401623.1 bifunctional 3-(3-hydroxy-phenyl)propionate/3-hydroxycinnamic acid hydroxylase [Mycobacterium fragae]ORV61920.1 3-(3-hydroxyphenyl)propionate hydroxylase [Mycobacterium fragae]